MATEKQDDAELDTTNTNTNPEGQAEDTFEDRDNDPMLAGLKEAEAEIAAEAGKGKTEEEGAPAPATTAAPAAKTADQPAEGEQIMIPKARLDAVLAEKDRERDERLRLQGVVQTQNEMIKAGVKATDNQGQDKSTPSVTDFDAKIMAAENDKIALSQKYEDGEISFKELREKEIEIDRNLRTLNDQRFDAKVENAKREATQVSKQVVAANNQQRTVEDNAVSIQAQHPYVAEIDKLPPAIRDGVWKEIGATAVKNLQDQGVVIDNSTESRLAVIKEKARLTDEFGPKYTGITLSNSQTPAQRQPSERALQREKKLDLAEQQPPMASTAGHGVDNHELSEADILNMSDERLADLYASNPAMVEKAAGTRTQR